MLATIILGISILVQTAAALWAALLVQHTGRRLAWGMISLGLAMMAVRRLITFLGLVNAGATAGVNLETEIVALAISLAMLTGVILIRPVFSRVSETRQNLRDSEHTYRRIIDNLDDIFFRQDNDGRILLASPSVQRILGYEVSELLGTQVTDLYADPGEAKRLEEEVQEKGRIDNFELALRRKDGSTVATEINAVLVVDEDGNVLGTEGICRDISRRIESEQLNVRMARIIEDSVNEILVFDYRSLRFLLVNRSARQNLGYTEEELCDMTVADLHPRFPGDQWTERIEELKAGKLDSLEFLTTLARKDGSRYEVDVRLQLSRVEQPPVYFAIMNDRTEERRNEAYLAQAQKMEAVGQLTGGVAHDFNNLLTVILGNLELAMLQEPGEEITRMLEQARHAGESGAALTQRLLAYSRKQALHPEVVNLAELVSGLQEMLRRTLGEEIIIEVEASPTQWLCEADPSQTENVILNLAINARDAMPGGGVLSIRTEPMVVDRDYAGRRPGMAPGEYMKLSVRDEGHGISEEVRQQIFEPFFTTKSRGQGSGLGLSMVYGFVKQTDGYIEVSSEVGAGTEFTIYLPRYCGEKIDHETSDEGAVAGRRQGASILVVEDDPGVGELVVSQLHQLGYTAHLAEDAGTGARILEENPDIELLLSDVVLPGPVNGVEFARESKEIRSDLKVLYMSGYTEDSLIRDGKLDADIALLQKPFRRDELHTAVRGVLGQEYQERDSLSYGG